MTWCSCPEMPACGFDRCRFPAEWSVLQPPWRNVCGPRAKFMCDWHAQAFRKAITTPLKAIDRPAGDDEWRGSIMEHVQHGQMAWAFENRNKAPQASSDMSPRRPDDATRFTPAQLQQLAVLRKHLSPMSPAERNTP